jgi:hypothetical protein
MRAKGSRSDYIIQVHLILMAYLRWRNNFKEISKFVLVCVQLSLAFHVGSLDVGDVPASFIKFLGFHHGYEGCMRLFNVFD